MQTFSGLSRPVSVFRHPVFLRILLIVLGLLISVWLAGRLGEQRAWQERSIEGQGQLQLYQQTLHTLVERFRSVPALLALDKDVRSLLRSPEDQHLRQSLNERLARLNQAAGSSVLYLIDRHGDTLAASNWDEASSFVGHNYAFRPYFQDALQDVWGRYFAVGVTTGVPGYFLSHAIEQNGVVTGVLVVKLELEDLQRDWLGQPGTFLVTADDQVVILSNRPAWRFRHLEPLAAEQRVQLIDARKYAEQTLQAMISEPLRRIDTFSEVRRVAGPDGLRDYFWQRLGPNQEGWTLHLLQEPNVVMGKVQGYRLSAAGLWMTLAFLVLFLIQRRRNQHLLQSRRTELERLVVERTAELRKAQDELVQAAKLAALGQMSAALAHELNQPLTAMRMQLGSLRLLQRSGRDEQVQEVLTHFDSLLQRMAGLTSHLKVFARESPGGLRERLSLAHVLDQALQLLAPRLRTAQVLVDKQVDVEAWVLGDAIRLEQVLVNLLDNALDATAHQPHPELRIRSRRTGEIWQLSVSDNGGGIAAEHLQRLFDPFFTTKPVGEGLGLGLAISYGIVRDLGGSLGAATSDDGAVFTLTLPAADTEHHSSQRGHRDGSSHLHRR